MLKVVLLLALSASVPLVHSGIPARTSYDGFKIFRVEISSPTDLRRVKNLADGCELLAERSPGFSDILLSPKSAESVKAALKLYNLNFEVVNNDVGGTVRDQEIEMGLKSNTNKTWSHGQFHSYPEIVARLEELTTIYPNKTELINIGKSHEGRDIMAIRITDDMLATKEKKAILWLDGGIHAREWVAPATVMFLIHAILGEAEEDKQAYFSETLRTYQFVIAPVINPDGYQYSINSDRLWRKTRKPSGCKMNQKLWFGPCFIKNCIGSDPNRNWDEDWNGAGVSSDRCSDVYPGSQPFDQPSVAAVADFLSNHKAMLKLYITYHSYSQLFLTPYAYTTATPPHSQHHKKVGDAVVKAIQGRHGLVYQNIQGSSLYMASGGSFDWVYKTLGVVDSYGFELRDSGRYGFLVPPDQIEPCGEENTDALIAILNNLFSVPLDQGV